MTDPLDKYARKVNNKNMPCQTFSAEDMLQGAEKRIQDLTAMLCAVCNELRQDAEMNGISYKAYFQQIQVDSTFLKVLTLIGQQRRSN